MLQKHLKLVLIVSLSLNLLGAAVGTLWVVKKGGSRYLFEQLGFIDTVYKPRPFHEQWEKNFRRLPNPENEIVFLGDSITHGGRWGGVFGRITNRGRGGDTTLGILSRLDEVTESNPQKVFINIGTNDLSQEMDYQEVADNYREIIQSIRRQSPDTQIYVCSVLPINTKIKNDYRLTNKQRDIPLLNAELKKLEQLDHVHYIDLYSEFVDPQGQLIAEYTHDGLHLTFNGYMKYYEVIKPYVVDQQ